MSRERLTRGDTEHGFGSKLKAIWPSFRRVFWVAGLAGRGGDRLGHIKVGEVASARQVAAVDAPTLCIWDGVQRIRSIGGARALAFSPDGTKLAVEGVGQIGTVNSPAGPSRVEAFHWSRQERVHVFIGQNGIVNRLYWDPQNRWLCAIGGGSNGLVMFHDVTRQTMIHQANVPMHVHDAAFNEDGTRLYAAGHNRLVVMEMLG